MIADLVRKSRTYRRFYQDVPISEETLRGLVDLARLSPSGRNAQPLKYKISWKPETNEKIFPTLGWAGYLKEWGGPVEGERPAGYIIILGDKEIAANYGSEKEQVKAAKSAVDNAKENGRVTATNKEVLNSLKDSKEAKAIAEALRKVWAYLDGEVIVDVDKLARLLDKTESLSQAMREYKKGGIK